MVCVQAELMNRGVAPAAAAASLDLFGTAFPGDLGERLAADVRGTYAFEQLKILVGLCEGTPAGRHLRVDASLARGLSYYTGAIMEIHVKDLAGSLGVGETTTSSACFGALSGAASLARTDQLVMTERNMSGERRAGCVDVMVTIWSHDTREQSLSLASTLRASGLRVDLYPEADKLGKQVKYASSRHVPFVAILGDDERARGEVSVKDLRTGQQQSVARSDAAAFIRSRLTGPPDSPLNLGAPEA